MQMKRPTETKQMKHIKYFSYSNTGMLNYRAVTMTRTTASHRNPHGDGLRQVVVSCAEKGVLCKGEAIAGGFTCHVPTCLRQLHSPWTHDRELDWKAHNATLKASPTPSRGKGSTTHQAALCFFAVRISRHLEHMLKRAVLQLYPRVCHQIPDLVLAADGHVVLLMHATLNALWRAQELQGIGLVAVVDGVGHRPCLPGGMYRCGEYGVFFWLQELQ